MPNPSPPTGFLDSVSEVLEPGLLLRSIISVFSRYERDGLKPGAERWTNNLRHYRPQLIADVINEFCSASGTLPSEFPFHDDFIVRLWIGFRKLDPKSKAYVREQIGGVQHSLN